MAIDILELRKMGLNTGKENTCLRMVHTTRAIGKITKCREKVIYFSEMEELNIRDSGVMINLTVGEY